MTDRALYLYTDFGLEGPYVGQMRAAVAAVDPRLQVVDLCHDLAPFRPRPAAYLLAALAPWLPEGSVCVAVVDPGVGGARDALVLEADGRRYVGPDNGLLAVVARRARTARWWTITWRPGRLSASFHGRDLFAPVGARLAAGQAVALAPRAAGDHVGADWPEDLAEVIYVDRYGNAMTGLRAGGLAPDARLEAGGRLLARARTFCDVPPGAAFWYENANGLAEIAVNQGRADQALGLAVGAPVRVHFP